MVFNLPIIFDRKIFLINNKSLYFFLLNIFTINNNDTPQKYKDQSWSPEIIKHLQFKVLDIEN